VASAPTSPNSREYGRLAGACTRSARTTSDRRSSTAMTCEVRSKVVEHLCAGLLEGNASAGVLKVARAASHHPGLSPDPPLILAGGELWLAGCGAAADMSRGQG